MKLLDIITGNRKYATFFDRHTADEAWRSINQHYNDLSQKLEYDDGDLEKIAMHLSKDPKVSQNHLNSGKIGIVGKDTRLYIPKDNETPSEVQNKPDDLNERYSVILQDAMLKGKTHRNMGKIDSEKVDHREIYFVIPEGTRLNGKTYSNRVVKTIPLYKDAKVPDLFVSLLKDHYNNVQITEIYDILTGSSNPIPETKRSLLSRVGIPTAVSAAILATAIGGLYTSKKAMDNPKYRVEVENAAKIPNTNIYNARYTKL